MSEHDKLREAIAWARDTHPTCHWHEMFTLLADAAESTLPQTKMVEVWHVEWAFMGAGCVGGFSSRDAAQREADWLNAQDGCACIRVTGPHQQEVPA